MKKQIQVLLFFLIMIILVGIIGAYQVSAADEYSLSIQSIDYTPQSNLMSRSVTVPSVVSDFENVHVDKYCYTGETFSLTAIIVPSNAYVGKVNWTIEQGSTIAEIVSQNGLTVSIRGVKAGTCKIVCTAADGQGAYTTCNLTVLQHATQIVLTPKDLLLEPGDREQIMAEVVPADTTDKTFSWSSSNPEIAKVDKDGVVTGVSASLETVTITCTMLDGSGVVGTASVNVRVLVEVIEWQKFSNVIYKKGNNVEKFYTSILPNHATIPTLKYTSSNVDVATVMADLNDNNCVLITPKQPGTFKLTCEATDGSGVKLTTEIEVIQLVEYVTLSETSKILMLQNGVPVTHQLRVKSALPSNANALKDGIDNAFIWSSSDETIATVDQTGLVTAIKPGEVTITATANDVGAASASCTIYVRKPVTSMSIDLYSFEYLGNGSTNVELLDKLQYLNGIAYVYSGDEVALNAIFNEDATLKTVFWQISGQATDANNKTILGIFARVSDPYTNPTIMTALPINAGNAKGYLNIVINVKAMDGSGVTATRVVQVRQPTTSLTIDKTTMTLYTPDSGAAFASMGKLNATILPENAYVNKNPDKFPDGNIIWTSSNEDVATVSSDGHVNAVGPGEATIYGKSADGHGEVASCKVTVLQAIKKIELFAYQNDEKIEIKNNDKIYAYTNQEIRLFTNITPESASNQKLVWTSGDPTVATVDNGFLKIGNIPTVSEGSVKYISITCSATDGSGKSLQFRLYVLDSEYNIEVDEFLSVYSGDRDSLLLKVSRNDNSTGKPVQVPINVKLTVTLSGNSVSVGNNNYKIIELYDESGTSIETYDNKGNLISNSKVYDSITNPSFDIKACYNGVTSITFNIEPLDRNDLLKDGILIGKRVSFERTCTVNIIGNDNRTIAVTHPSISMLVGTQKQINAVVSPANATNYYIEYVLEGFDESELPGYSNPLEFARIDKDTGIVTGVDVGVVKVLAKLYDKSTQELVTTNGIDQIATTTVYITDALTGVSMEDAVVYVGETVDYLSLVQLKPAALNQTLDKASTVRFEFVSGAEYIQPSSTTFGSFIGVENGSVTMRAIASYGDAIFTSNDATIEVRTKLLNISLPSSYSLKINQTIKLTPTRSPINGDLSKAKIRWESSNTNIITVDSNPKDNYGFSGVVTARKSTWNSSKQKHEPVKVTAYVTIDGKTVSAETWITVIQLDVDEFSADTTNKLYTLTTDGYRYYRYGAYSLKSGGTHYAAGCLENGASSLSTPYLSRSSAGGVAYYKGTYYYPDKYPLKTFVALERTRTLIQSAANHVGVEYDYLVQRLDDAVKIYAATHYAPGLSEETKVRIVEDAYLDLPGRSHFLDNSSNQYRHVYKDFSHWTHTSDKTTDIIAGVFASSTQDMNKSPAQIITDLSGEFMQTNMTESRISNAYFTSALTSLNVLAGNQEIAQRQTNAMSIINTYFPLDKVYDKEGASDNYLLQHVARQLLIWSVSGIKVSASEYRNCAQGDLKKYAYETENYAGDPLYYVCYMLQSDAMTSANYVDYPYGYSAFYYILKNVVAPSRVTYSGDVDKVMVIIEGFAWKMDQCRHRTIPSFASTTAALADDEINIVKLYPDGSGGYKTRLVDTNGVLNYYKFAMNGVQFTNNGDGTLSVYVAPENVQTFKNAQAAGYVHSTPAFIPEDNEYSCAAFAKWEMETEICQIPYTKASNGSLAYAYILGNNAQSQYISVKDDDIKSSLGDPVDAYVCFELDETGTFDSQVVSNVQIYDLDGNEVEYIIPNEQYQLKYTFTYIGDSRGLVLTPNDAAMGSVRQNVYGFAADMRARGNNEKASLINLASDEDWNGVRYKKTTQNATVSNTVWMLDADQVAVNMKGNLAFYGTPADSAHYQTWNSGNMWNDTLFIDANVADEVRYVSEIVESSNHPCNIKVTKDYQGKGKVYIEWTFYTGHILFTTPYAKANADIDIPQDNTHVVEKKLNEPNAGTDKYIYGLVVNGDRAVRSYAASGTASISSYTEYVNHYKFTGLAGELVALAAKQQSATVATLPIHMFSSSGYATTDGEPLSSYSVSELMNKGSSKNDIGTIFYYTNNGKVVGIIANMGAHGSTTYVVYWISSEVGGTGKFTGSTWNDAISKLSGKYNNSKSCYYEDEFVYTPATNTDGEGDAGFGSQRHENPVSDSMSTSFVDSSQWKVPASIDIYKTFTMTNPRTYGGSGYMEDTYEEIYANNATNQTAFHTDKTWTTVFDLTISDLVVNTGAGITSPTSIDTRNYVNLNVYYTINLDNSAYRVISNRYGNIGDIWWHYFKETYEDGTVQATEAKEYIYKKTDFFYLNSSGNRVYCKSNESPQSDRTYYYDPNKTGDKSLPDRHSVGSTNRGNFIPDARENIVLNSSSYSHPAGWAEEKKLDRNIHTDVFTNFCIYDNATLTNKLDPATFGVLSPEEQWVELDSREPTTKLYFIDNIQTGENYIQHTVPYVLTAIESGVKVYGFSAHVNKTYNNSAGVTLTSGDNITINKALGEWGEKIGKIHPQEWTGTSSPGVEHYFDGGDINAWYSYSTSVLGYKTAVVNRLRGLSQPLKVGTAYKKYYYAADYDWAYNNNDTATSMLQYPSYNPYTMSTVSSNGSLIYNSAAGISGFDLILGNNQYAHVPNLDSISYLMYMRKFGNVGDNNLVDMENAYAVRYQESEHGCIFVKSPYSRARLMAAPMATIFKYNSLNFYKYSNSTYDMHYGTSVGSIPIASTTVDGTTAITELVNQTQAESYKITKVLFRSTYTTAHKLGENGWVDVTSGNHADAIVNAGKGFEIKVEVTYTNNNLTDYLVRYLKNSAQVSEPNDSSAGSNITSSACNISALTGEFGTKSMTDQYTAKIIDNSVWNNVFGSNVYEDLYVIMNNNNKYVYSYTGVYGSTQIFDMDSEYLYDEAKKTGSIVMTYTMKLSPVNGFFGNSSDTTDKTGLATQNMKFYTDASAAGTVGSLTVWTNPIAATPFGYPGNMRDRYLADLVQLQYYITQPVDNVDNIVQ